MLLSELIQMKFIKSTLPDNETIEMEISFHWTHTLVAWLYLLFLGWLIIGVFLFISMYLEKWTTERALTNRRLVIKRGLIRRQTLISPYSSASLGQETYESLGQGQER